MRLAALLFLSACGLGAEDNFTRGLNRDRCEGTFPICQTTAGCVMGSTKYIEGAFPGTRQFVVPAPEEAVIRVQLFFKTQRAVGVDTEVLWHEPGCFDTYRWSSEGRDIFEAAGASRVLEVSQQVLLEGDHLVEVYSDAVAEFALRVDVEVSGGVP